MLSTGSRVDTQPSKLKTSPAPALLAQHAAHIHITVWP